MCRVNGVICKDFFIGQRCHVVARSYLLQTVQHVLARKGLCNTILIARSHFEMCLNWNKTRLIAQQGMYFYKYTITKKVISSGKLFSLTEYFLIE